MEIVLLLIGLVVGFAIGFLLSKSQKPKGELDSAEWDKKIATLETEKLLLAKDIEHLNKEVQNIRKEFETQKFEIFQQKNEIQKKLDEEQKNLSAANSRIAAATEIYNKNQEKIKELDELVKEKQEEYKKEIENLQEKLTVQFENVANKILNVTSEKFTKQNQDNLSTILKPLGDNLENFKKKVEEVYDKESKERFSLGKEVEKLVTLNNKISEDATNLTNALKGNSKIQGDWGQMILENILEKSGLVKDREYFIQEFLKDEDGNYLKNEDGIKMQPDVIIAYPDNRKVIVDSKVSLTAYIRYSSTEIKEEQKKAIDDHLKSIRNHIDDLSKKSYQDFASSLDFVMMFIPNEPAYLIALQHDPELWHYAYTKRILLISPTNLIASLKLIVDLWKREFQNRNAQEIAERGAILYDKLVGFVENLISVGDNIEKTQKSYTAAFGQLKEGRGNLIGQAEKLKELGVKPKKNLPSSLATDAINEEHEKEIGE